LVLNAIRNKRRGIIVGEESNRPAIFRFYESSDHKIYQLIQFIMIETCIYMDRSRYQNADLKPENELGKAL